MAEKVKIKTEYGTISATPAQAEAWKAREEREKVQQERIAAVRENARAMSRYRQEREIAKGQRRAREERSKGGYDATPTGRFGQPVESFWTAEPPQMPEMRPVPQLPEIPQLPITALADKMRTPEAISFYRDIEHIMRPKYRTAVGSVGKYLSGPYEYGQGFQTRDPETGIIYNERWAGRAEIPWNQRTRFAFGTPMQPNLGIILGENKRYSPVVVGEDYGATLPIFPYWGMERFY